MYSHSICETDYFNHKEYFDSKLVDLLEKQRHHINRCKKTMGQHERKIDTLERCVSQLKVDKIILKDNLQQLKSDNKNKDQKIDELQHTLDELSEIVRNDLGEAIDYNEQLQNENDKLKKEIERLKKQLNLNSTNSSKPSSTDGYFVRPQNSRKKTNLNIGGQQGHQLHKSRLSDKYTSIIEKHVRKAPLGALAIKDKQSGDILYYVTQEVNMTVSPFIVETRYYVDNNQSEEKQIMKQYAINPVSYHPHFISIVLYLCNTGNIAMDRLCSMMNEISDGEIKIRPGTIAKWMKRFAKQSIGKRQIIIDNILKSKITHVNETGWKVKGKLEWMHVMTNENNAYFIVTKKRGDDENGPIGILKDYTGYLEHDHFKKYYCLDKCIHVECNAHILRYLKEGAELDNNEECKQMIEVLQKMNHERKEKIENKSHEFKEEEIKEYEKTYIDIAKQGIEKYEAENPETEKRYIPKYLGVFKRMIEYKDEHLMFIRDFQVPFDNNAAERQCRVIKGKKKISGQSQSQITANHFAAYLTVSQTCKLRKVNILKEIEEILLN